MAALPIALAILSVAVLAATALVASRIQAFAQDERDHRDLRQICRAAIVRAPSGHAVNDNAGAFTVHELTMVGFTVGLLVAIAAGTLIVCGVV